MRRQDFIQSSSNKERKYSASSIAPLVPLQQRAALIAMAAWLCQAQLSSAQMPALSDQLLAAYSKLESYCATAHRQSGNDPTAARKMEHCVHKDGRHKNLVTGPREFEIGWGDGEFHYSQSHHQPTWKDAQPIESFSWVETRHVTAADVPPVLDHALRWYHLSAVSMEHLRDRFRAFEPKPELATAQLAVYEERDGDHPGGTRVWVSREDGLIRRVDHRSPIFPITEVTEVRLNQPLTPAQLVHEAPLGLRLRSVVKRYAVLIVVAASPLGFALGFVFWRFRRRAGSADALASRAHCWQIYRRVLAWTVAPAILLALFAPTGGDMSGAARKLEGIGWVALYLYLLWLAGLFLLARHFADVE